LKILTWNMFLWETHWCRLCDWKSSGS